MTERPSRRRFLRASSVLATGAAAGAGGLGWTFGVEPRWIERVRQEVRLPGLPPALDGLRVVHLSDIHASDAVPLDFVRRVVDEINAESGDARAPDLAVLTGDFVTEDRAWIPGVARELGRLRARLGTYAILGNHDYWTDGPSVSRALEAAGVRHLRNENALLGGAGGLRLVGIDDHWTGNDDLDRAMAGVGPREPTLLLMHSPDLAYPAAAAGIPLALCGHTHGGQVRLPGLGALIVPSVHGFEAGWYTVGGTRMYVNRGLGTLDLKVRFCCRPEVHELTLRTT